MGPSSTGRAIVSMFASSERQTKNAADSPLGGDDDNDVQIITKRKNSFEKESDENKSCNHGSEQTRPIRNHNAEAGSLVELTAMVKNHHRRTRGYLARHANDLAESLSKNIISSTGNNLDQVARISERHKREAMAAMPAIVSDSLTHAIRPLLEQMENQILAFDAVKQKRSSEIQHTKEMEQRVTDTTVESLWKQLGYKIRDLARKLARFEVIGSRLPQTVQTVMEAIAPEYIDLLNDEELNESVWNAYLWRLLYKDVFEGSEAFFGNSPRLHLKRLRASLISQMDTKKQLEASISVVEWLCSYPLSISQDMLLEECNLFSTQVLTDISAFLKPRQDKTYRGSAREQIFQDMLSIMRQAVKLDNIFGASKSIFNLGYSTEKRLLFEEDSMEAEVWNAPPDGNTEVHFMISPFMVKFGDADGQHYDDSIRLGKAAVVCK